MTRTPITLNSIYICKALAFSSDFIHNPLKISYLFIHLLQNHMQQTPFTHHHHIHTNSLLKHIILAHPLRVMLKVRGFFVVNTILNESRCMCEVWIFDDRSTG